jgi:hypothetical protein
MSILTFQDLIDRMKAEGQLTRNSGSNSIKTMKSELSFQSNYIKQIFDIMNTRYSKESLKPIPIELPDNQLENNQYEEGFSENGDTTNDPLMKIYESVLSFHESFIEFASLVKDEYEYDRRIQKKQEADKLQSSDSSYKTIAIIFRDEKEVSPVKSKKGGLFGGIFGLLKSLTKSFLKPLKLVFTKLIGIGKKIILPFLGIFGVLNGISAAIESWNSTEGEHIGTRLLKAIGAFVKDFVSSIGGLVMSLFTGESYKESKKKLGEKIDMVFDFIRKTLESIQRWIGDKFLGIKKIAGTLNDEDLKLADNVESQREISKEQKEEEAKTIKSILEDQLPNDYKNQVRVNNIIGNMTNQQLYELADKDYDDFASLLRYRNDIPEMYKSDKMTTMVNEHLASPSIQQPNIPSMVSETLNSRPLPDFKWNNNPANILMNAPNNVNQYNQTLNETNVSGLSSNAAWSTKQFGRQ